MKHLVFSGLLIFTGGLLAACGGGDHAPPIPDLLVGSSGAGGKGGHPGVGVGGLAEVDGGVQEDAGAAAPVGSGGTAGGDGGSVTSALAPLITFKYPVATNDPDSGLVLMDDMNTANVVCHVEQSKARGAKPIDTSSVTLEMLDASGKSLTMPAQGAVPVQGQANDFTSPFIYTNVPNGRVFFRCNAKDQGGLSSSATVGTFVDHGPKITLLSPTKKAVPLKQLVVEFTVEADPLLPTGDDGAAVVDKTVTLDIAGKSIDLGKAEVTSGHYKVSDLTGLFPTGLGAMPTLVISVANKRGFTNTLSSTFAIDNVGPTISLDTPNNNDLIGGTTTVQFEVKDNGSGVNRNSVTVQVNNEMPIQWSDSDGRWTEHMGVYTFLLDSGAVKGASIQVNLNVTAMDNAGNSSDDSQSSLSVTYYLDTTPPRFDLDPGPLQELAPNGTCSKPFDPLGTTTNDLDGSVGFVVIRALCYDDGNFVPGLPQGRYSGIDQMNGPRLYVQGNTAAGLLTGPAKGVCNDLDTSVPSFALYALPPQGNAYYPATPASVAIPNENPKKAGQFLCGNGNDSSEPTHICSNTSDLSRIIQHEQGAAGPPEPVIYGLLSDPCLMVSQLQISTKVAANGWVCLAVRGHDKKNNIGVSAPMRVCLNDPDLGAPPKCALPMSSADDPPPSCTTNCTAPPHFMATNRIDDKSPPYSIDPPHSLAYPYIVRPPF